MRGGGAAGVGAAGRAVVPVKPSAASTAARSWARRGGVDSTARTIPSASTGRAPSGAVTTTGPWWWAATRARSAGSASVAPSRTSDQSPAGSSTVAVVATCAPQLARWRRSASATTG